MNNEKDFERVGSFSVPPPSFGERALGILARAERILTKVGKVGLVLLVLYSGSVCQDSF